MLERTAVLVTPFSFIGMYVLPATTVRDLRIRACSPVACAFGMVSTVL